MAKKQGTNGAKPIQATPASEWAAETELVTLPSGHVAELRRPDVIDLIANGEDAPDLLTSVVLAQINRKARTLELTPETLPQVMQMMNLIVAASFVAPKVPDELPLARLSFNDKSFVFAWALGAQYEAAANFRHQQAGGVEFVPPVQDVPAESEPDVRDTE